MMLTAEEVSEATEFPTYKQLKEWCEANAEGRLLILPCKVGSEVYRIIDDCDFPGDCGTKMKCKGCEYRNIYVERQLFSLQMIKDIGETVFLTYEEAETALRIYQSNYD